ncbi:MAG: autoinducer binding domain-containing protein [Myxococcota bacterium]
MTPTGKAWLEEALDQLAKTSPGSPALLRWMADHLSKLGFDRVIHLNVANPTDVNVFSTLPSWWNDEYRERNYAEVDPFLHVACRSYHPTYAGVAFSDQLDLNERQLDFVHGGAKAGLSAGITIPVVPGSFADERPFGGWVLGSAVSPDEVRARWRDQGGAIHLATTLAHHRIVSAAPTSHPNPLSERERECLRGLAEGLQQKEIAHRLGVVGATVEFHLRNARRKLGASTAAQALAIAIQRRHLGP